MSTGPFDLEVGEQVSLSFGIVFGQNINDLLLNAYSAQILYNRHYSASQIDDYLDNGNIGVPNEYSLKNPYPNAFNPTTTISFVLPQYGNIKLVIYDLLGREVEVLYNNMQKAGYHQINWNANRYASGLYFVTLIAGEYVNTQKLMLIK